MRKKNIFLRLVGGLARKFRIFQETWIFPWWENKRMTTVPLWALDTFVLVLKLCSTCVMGVVRILVPRPMKSLNGETVLITGAGSGIGRELAIQLAELGAAVVCWDVDTKRNNTVVEEIREKDGDSLGYTVDVTMSQQVTTAAASLRRVADVSIVISNAGTLTHAPFIDLQCDEITKMIFTNLLAHFWVIKAFLPAMIERGRGHIIAINSSAGLVPNAQMVPYCAAKYGLRGLMDSISEELRLAASTRNIYTTSVYLGAVSTGMYPTPSHRFTSWYYETSPKDAAKIIIQGLRRNKRCITIPIYMKLLADIVNLIPYRIRIILTDFFNYAHRAWFFFC